MLVTLVRRGSEEEVRKKRFGRRGSEEEVRTERFGRRDVERFGRRAVERFGRRERGEIREGRVPGGHFLGGGV